MSKRFYLPVFLFLLALVIDLISTSSYSTGDALSRLESNVNQFLEKKGKSILETDLLDLMRAPSLSIEQLNKLKQFESQVIKNNLKVEVYDDGGLIFWSGEKEINTYCRHFGEKEYHVKICSRLFDNNGHLYSHPIEGVSHSYKISKTPESDINLFDIPVKIEGRQRSLFIQTLSLSLYVFALIFFIIFSIRATSAMPFVVAIGFRIIIFFLPWQHLFPDLALTGPLFTSTDYCSIDLFIDAILIFGILCAISREKWLFAFKTGKLFMFQSGIFFLIFGLLSHIRLVQMLVNSKEVLNNFSDISQFSSTDIFVVIALLLLLLSIFVYSNTLFISIQDNRISKKNTYIHTVIGIAVASILAYYIGLDLNSGILAIFLFSWVLLFDLFTDVKQKNITWLIWWAIFLAVYLSAVFFNYDIKKEIKLRKSFLAEAIKPVPKDALLKQYDSPELQQLDSIIYKLLDLPEGMKINKEDFLDYLKTQSHLPIGNIYISNASGEPIFTKGDEVKFPDNLVMINAHIAFDQVGDKAWFSRKISDRFQCYLEVYNDSIVNTKSYPFNYYKDDNLLHADFNISTIVFEDIKASQADYLFKNSNVFIKWQEGNTMLVSKKSFESLIKPIALFSLLFCLIIIFGLILSVSSIWMKYLPEEWPFNIQRADTLNAKIQISLILVILFSFIVIALITNSFLNNFLENEKEKYFLDKIVSISNDIKYQTEVAESAQEMVAISVNFADRIAYIHDVDIRIYALDSLRQSDRYFNYAYFSKNNNHNAYTEELPDGSASSYVPLKYNGKTAAYAIINYHNPGTNPVHVFDFLGSIFNVYVFLFLIASVLAIFMARSITKPLDLLNQKLAKLQLGKRNELIVWDKEDEIGNLISNYNNMVHQLEESAQILAKTERDSAWREMAKQVAHEIKNPLTPMKLSIQYLEKAIKQNPDEAVNISKKISSTLLEQIDNLSEIANAFGNFAELPQSSNVKVEINEVVEMVHNLFRKREDMDITLSEPIDPIYVYGDKNQLIRILNNLVKNAVESVPISRRGKIKLSLYTENENAIIKVADNGEGIAPEMEDKIFQPKFTTKDSGSGLGLAISANMIESMNGRLYFESNYGEGTAFYIELDIIRPSNYQDQDKRITLD